VMVCGFPLTVPFSGPRVRLLHAPIPADQPAVSKYNNDHNQHGKLIC